MSHNHQKKIAVINDLSGFGRCSIAVSMPVISHMGIQVCPLPTSIFSNHTGFPEYFFDDYTEKMPSYIENWKKLGLRFRGITSGFLGSQRQIEIVRQFIEDFKDPDTKVLIDPVMGDNGKPYATYTKEMCQEMKQLAKYAEIELLVQLGEYKQGADPEADFALSHIDKINAFLRQGLSEKSTFDETIKALEQVIA